MEKVSALEARRNLGRLLNIVLLKKEDVIIERSGTPVAKLTTCDSTSKQPTGQIDFRKMKGVGKNIWKKNNSEEYIAREREQWD
ncbi:MAG: type II toxin-antitoxin system Phd/YefM family antitoxin [Deltaproteobacteria bacterium]|jgi:prevent-host-death family protein|nr:type II toxin-antitoxin system Phd/YefM family antitoxin [Deltaproteobacteria bacterium]MBT4527839.1 type II toxin-antitoxin system Phd/YefM family antitoxin [Deltaproteobacteria bacterium]